MARKKGLIPEPDDLAPLPHRKKARDFRHVAEHYRGDPTGWELIEHLRPWARRAVMGRSA